MGFDWFPHELNGLSYNCLILLTRILLVCCEFDLKKKKKKKKKKKDKMSNRLLIVATQIMVMCTILGSVLLFMGLGILILLHICVVGRALRGGQNALARGERCDNEGDHGLSSDELMKLSLVMFLTKKGRRAAEVFQTGELCRLLPMCTHSFNFMHNAWIFSCQRPLFARSVELGLVSKREEIEG